MKRHGLIRMLAVCATCFVAVVSVFYVIVIRSRMSYSYRFLDGHKPLFRGMSRAGRDIDVDVYSWKEPQERVADRAMKELSTHLAPNQIQSQSSMTTTEEIHIEIGEDRAISLEETRLEWAWVTVRISKPLPNNWISSIRGWIEDLWGNRRQVLVY